MTKHSATCTMSFGKPHPETGCARCVELANGAPARTWRTAQRTEQQTIRDIRNHNCAASHCGPVCTAFDW